MLINHGDTLDTGKPKEINFKVDFELKVCFSINIRIVEFFSRVNKLVFIITHIIALF